MGAEVCQALDAAPDLERAAAVDVGESREPLAAAEVVVDFTTPDAVMDNLQKQMMANIEKVSPEALMQSWFTFDPKIAERFQDMFVTMAGLGGVRASDKKK